MEVPAGWFEVIRGRRPKSESWPKAERKGSVRPQPDRGGGRQPRRNGTPPSVPTGGNERRTPEEALQAARARVAKLEAAISAVGESDPTFPALQEALRQARKHAQVQPVESRIKSSEFFIELAKKRVENARKEVEDAKAKAVAAEMTLTSEVRALQDGEQRHASLLAERVAEEPVCTVAELQREREELRSRVGAARCCHTTRGGSPTQVNSVVVNTSIRFDGATQPIGDQWLKQSEPLSVDGDIDRRRISSGVP